MRFDYGLLVLKILDTELFTINISVAFWCCQCNIMGVLADDSKNCVCKLHHPLNKTKKLKFPCFILALNLTTTQNKYHCEMKH